MDQLLDTTGTAIDPNPPVDPDAWAAAKATYRYLRLSIVIVIATLAVSLAQRIVEHHCIQGSISAFYYTPVHSVFVAALALIGVALIAIRGATPIRETLLNMAGFLAPIVAFVPTDRPTPRKAGRTCPLDDSIGIISHRFVDNNLWAFLIGGVIAVAAVVIPVLLKRSDKTAVVKKVATRFEVFVPAIGATLVLAALLVWRWRWSANFEKHAHSYSAIVMFIFAGLFVAITAWHAAGVYRALYWASAAIMAAGIVCAYVIAKAKPDYYYTVFIVEVIDTTGFLLFWLAQSIELWGVGVRVKEYTNPAKAIPAGQ